MSKKTIFNLETLVSVSIKDKRRCNFLKYKPKRNFLLFTIEEGFWTDIERYPIEYLKTTGYYYGSPMLIEDKVAYFKPSVTLSFYSKETFTKEFDTYEEALKWGQAQASKGMYVKLEIEDK